MGTGLVLPEGSGSTSALAWVEVTEWHICDGSRPSSGQASDQANWWGQAGVGNHDGQVRRKARRNGRIRRESHRVTATEPGGPPPQKHRNDTHRFVERQGDIDEAHL